MANRPINRTMRGTQARTTKRDLVSFLQPRMHSCDKVAPFRTRVSISDAAARMLRGNLNPMDSPCHSKCNRLHNHMPRRRTCSHIRRRTVRVHRTMPNNNRQRLPCSRSRLQLQPQLSPRTSSRTHMHSNSSRISSHKCRLLHLRPPFMRSPRRRWCLTNNLKLKHRRRTHHLPIHPHRHQRRLKSKFNPNPKLKLNRKCKSSSSRR